MSASERALKIYASCVAGGVHFLRGEGGQEISAKIAAFFNFSSKIIGSAHRMQTDGLTDCMTGKDEEHAIRLGPKES